MQYVRKYVRMCDYCKRNIELCWISSQQSVFYTAISKCIENNTDAHCTLTLSTHEKHTCILSTTLQIPFHFVRSSKESSPIPFYYCTACALLHVRTYVRTHIRTCVCVCFFFDAVFAQLQIKIASGHNVTIAAPSLTRINFEIPSSPASERSPLIANDGILELVNVELFVNGELAEMDTAVSSGQGFAFKTDT